MGMGVSVILSLRPFRFLFTNHLEAALKRIRFTSSGMFDPECDLSVVLPVLQN